MNALILTSLLSLGALSYAQTVDGSGNTTTSDCPAPGGAHIIVARASTEPEGYGIIGAVKDVVLSRVPGSTAEFVVYPATLNNYVESESDGVVAMKALTNAFIAKCSGTPLVLMGYSQGAQVTADTLVGQEDNGFGLNASISSPLPDSTLSRIAAGIMMGDPTFTTTESSFHVGNSSHDGIFPRKDVSNFDATGLSSRLQTYCNAGDPYCAAGNFSMILVHLQYVVLYKNQSSDFVVNQIQSWYQRNPSSASTGGMSIPSIPKPTVSGSRLPPAPSASGARNATRSATRSAGGSMTASPTSSPSSSSSPIAATGAAIAIGQNLGTIGTLSSVFLGALLTMLL